MKIFHLLLLLISATTIQSTKITDDSGEIWQLLHNIISRLDAFEVTTAKQKDLDAMATRMDDMATRIDDMATRMDNLATRTEVNSMVSDIKEYISRAFLDLHNFNNKYATVMWAVVDELWLKGCNGRGGRIGLYKNGKVFQIFSRFFFKLLRLFISDVSAN